MPDDANIKAFIENRASSAEAEEVYKYLLANPDAVEKLRLMEDVSDQEITQVRYEIKAHTIKKILPSRRSWKLIQLLAGAAAFFVLVMFLWKTESQVKITHSIIQYNNHTEDTVTYYLPDSSQMMLVPGSQVTIKDNYAFNRQVNVLLGEICFSVVKNNKFPFTVFANNISTTAVGTRFWIRRIGKTKVGVSLLSGRVYINSVDTVFKMDTVFLNFPSSCLVSKNENRVHFYKQDTVTSKKADKIRSVESSSDKTGSILWTSDKMVFNNVSIINVLKKLEFRYKVIFLVKDTSINQFKITGQIFYNDSLDILIGAICQVNKLDCQRRGDTIMLRRR